METHKYVKYFSEKVFWSKIRNIAKLAGIKIVYSALLLYYTFKEGNITTRTKLIITGTLGYLLFPVDLVPDGLPMVGFADDVMIVLIAINHIAKDITPEIQEKAKKKLTDWFGIFNEEDVKEIDDKIKNQDFA
jgi:uncharacterized membrane protein YkvA (DUF1232 family)